MSHSTSLVGSATPRRSRGGSPKSTRYSPWRRVIVDPIANGTDIDISVRNRGRRAGGAAISAGSQPLGRAWPDHRGASFNRPDTARPHRQSAHGGDCSRAPNQQGVSRGRDATIDDEQQLAADNLGRSRGGSIAGLGIAPDRLADYIVASREPMGNCPLTGCVLVRPNGHVVWRCLAAGPDGP